MNKKSTILGLAMILGATAAMADGKARLKALSLKSKQQPGVSILGLNTPADNDANTLCVKPKLVPSKAPAQPLEAIKGNAYGFLVGPDGKDWYYTEDFQFEGYYYAGADVTIYDSEHNKRGSFHIDPVEGRSVNMMEPFGYITKKFFDRDENTLEVLVNIHCIGTADHNYMNDSYVTRVYNLEGEVVKEYPCATIMLNGELNSYETYQRLLLTYTAKVDSTSMNCIDVMRPASYGETEPQWEYTFKTPTELTEYSDGAYFNFSVINGAPYYIVSNYRKPWCTGYDLETFDPIVTPDNSYDIKVYDKKFQRVDSVSVPLEVPENRLYRFASFGRLSDRDLSKDYFTKDGVMDFVVTFADYDISSDEDIYSFDIYNAKNGKVATICDNVMNFWKSLKSIPRFEDQMAFGTSTEEDGEIIQMVNLPSLTKATALASFIDGEKISTYLDRYPVGDSYQYIVSMGSAPSDEQGNVIARLGWYDTNALFDHFTNFNIGPNAELFRPLINSSSLNPYLFDTDDQMEFIYLAKIKPEGSTSLEDVLVVADEDGTPIYTYRGDEEKGALRTVALLDQDSDCPELFIACYDYNSHKYNIEFQHLPFNGTGMAGEGTQANPYQITTAGQMQQIANDLKAHYVLANDIDMSKTAQSWTPINGFSGVLDGQDHVVRNLFVNSNATAVGLFGSLGTGATIKNIQLTDAELQLNPTNSYVGVVAGACTTDTIDNVHIYNAVIQQANDQIAVDGVIGGVAGYPSVFTLISNCSFQQGNIILPNNTSGIGSIAGDMRTSSYVTNSLASSTIEANSNVGGIVGVTGMDGQIRDCHAIVNINAKNTAGGIVGSNNSRAAIARCVAEGSIRVSEAASKWTKLNAGGILGYIETDWSKKEAVIINGNLTGISIHFPENDGSINRIVGFTAANENYEPGEKRLTELGLADNYATTSAILYNSSETEQAITNEGTTTPQGATMAVDTLSQKFLETIGYVFGNDATAPWMMDGNLPILYFEKIKTSVDGMQTAEGTLSFNREGETLNISGASMVCLYNANGKMVGQTTSGQLNTTRLAKGVYILVATLADGSKKAIKLAL